MASSTRQPVSDSSGGYGVDFHLPDEILAVIPTDPYEQLDVARKITSMAIASRVSRLEGDAARLRRDIADRDRHAAELASRVGALEHRVADSESRLQIALDENAKLAKERDMLTMKANKLARNLAKLEAFKKQLMQSLNEDNSNPETADIDDDDNLVARVPSWKDQLSSSHSTPNLLLGSRTTEAPKDGHQLSITPYVTPGMTPNATPKVASTSGSPRAYSAAGTSPRFFTGPPSPTKSHTFEGQSAFSSLYPSYQLSSAPTSPPERRSFSGRPRIDGKEFFRQARNRLSYEQFGAFLANVKEFNSQKQSREETLVKAEEIFGTENKDLYISFQNMLTRNQP